MESPGQGGRQAPLRGRPPRGTTVAVKGTPRRGGVLRSGRCPPVLARLARARAAGRARRRRGHGGRGRRPPDRDRLPGPRRGDRRPGCASSFPCGPEDPACPSTSSSPRGPDWPGVAGAGAGWLDPQAPVADADGSRGRPRATRATPGPARSAPWSRWTSTSGRDVFRLRILEGRDVDPADGPTKPSSPQRPQPSAGSRSVTRSRSTSVRACLRGGQRDLGGAHGCHRRGHRVERRSRCRRRPGSTSRASTSPRRWPRSRRPRTTMSWALDSSPAPPSRRWRSRSARTGSSSCSTGPPTCGATTSTPASSPTRTRSGWWPPWARQRPASCWVRHWPATAGRPSRSTRRSPRSAGPAPIGSCAASPMPR